MPMPEFPQLNSEPDVNFGHEVWGQPTYRSNPKGGALLVQNRTTAGPVRFRVEYPVLSDPDKQTLEAFERDTLRSGGLRFIWTRPVENKQYVVVLAGPILYRLHPKSGANLWICLFEILAIRRVPLLFGEGLFGTELFGEG